jgi:hypothetical protein
MRARSPRLQCPAQLVWRQATAIRSDRGNLAAMRSATPWPRRPQAACRFRPCAVNASTQRRRSRACAHRAVLRAPPALLRAALLLLALLGGDLGRHLGRHERVQRVLHQRGRGLPAPRAL